MGTRFILTAASLVIIVAGMRAAESIVTLLLLSAFFSILCAPPLIALEQRGIPSGMAILIVLGGFLGVGMAIATLIGTSLHDFLQALPEYQVRLQEETKGLSVWLKRKGIQVSTESFMSFFDPKAAVKLITTVLSGLGGMLSNTFFTLITVVFILLEASGFPGKMRAISGKKNTSLENMTKIINNVKHYMAIKTMMSFSTGVIVTLWLIILRVDYPTLWGLVAFFFNFVPNIGSIIAAIPAVMLAFLQFGFVKAFLVIVGYVVINVLVGNIVEPRFMGKGLGLSTLVVFLSLVFWGWVLGPVGMLLSVPLTMTVKIALEANEDTRWIAILLS